MKTQYLADNISAESAKKGIFPSRIFFDILDGYRKNPFLTIHNTPVRVFASGTGIREDGRYFVCFVYDDSVEYSSFAVSGKTVELRDVSLGIFRSVIHEGKIIAVSASDEVDGITKLSIEFETEPCEKNCLTGECRCDAVCSDAVCECFSGVASCSCINIKGIRDLAGKSGIAMSRQEQEAERRISLLEKKLGEMDEVLCEALANLDSLGETVFRGGEPTEDTVDGKDLEIEEQIGRIMDSVFAGSCASVTDKGRKTPPSSVSVRAFSFPGSLVRRSGVAD